MPEVLAEQATYDEKQPRAAPLKPPIAMLFTPPPRSPAPAFAQTMLGQKRVESALPPARLLGAQDRPECSPRNGVAL